MPTIILLAIAFQIQNLKGRYLFFALATANVIYNILHHAWVQEVYSAIIVLLLYTLNPLFLNWWENRNSRNNPSSMRQFASDTYQIAKYNKLRIVFWMMMWGASIAGIHFYSNYTEYSLLAWIVGIFISIYIFKQLFYSMLPPEWFLHDINTGYVFLGVFSAWGISEIMLEKLGAEFVSPMLIAAVICILGIYFARGAVRFLVPGCTVILTDIIWQVVRYFQDGMTLTPQFIITECILISAMLIVLVWLIKNPGILPIVYLAIFQLFRFTAFVYQGVNKVVVDSLTTPEVTYYILYLVCWMYIVPLLFLFKGVMQQEQKPSPVRARRQHNFAVEGANLEAAIYDKLAAKPSTPE